MGPKKTLLPLVPKDIENSESLANKQGKHEAVSPMGSPRLSTASPPGRTCWGKKDVPIDEDIVCAKLYALLLHIVQLTNHPVGQVLLIPNLEMGIQS